jgi:hypothetical protein
MPTYYHTRTRAVKTTDANLGYPWVSTEPEVTETFTVIARPVADAVLAEVGTDPVLAQQALDREQGYDSPRKVLSMKLQAIIDKASAEESPS